MVRPIENFWSRRAYELAYAFQRETKYDRALRRDRKLRLRLGGDPADDEYPDKPPRGCAGRRTLCSWTGLSRLMALWMNGFGCSASMASGGRGRATERPAVTQRRAYSGSK
jgi:hypothetical protein